MCYLPTTSGLRLDRCFRHMLLRLDHHRQTQQADFHSFRVRRRREILLLVQWRRGGVSNFRCMRLDHRRRMQDFHSFRVRCREILLVQWQRGGCRRKTRMVVHLQSTIRLDIFFSESRPVVELLILFWVSDIILRICLFVRSFFSSFFSSSVCAAAFFLLSFFFAFLMSFASCRRLIISFLCARKLTVIYNC